MKKDFESKMKKFNQKVKGTLGSYDVSERFVDPLHYQVNIKKKGTIKNVADIIYGEDAMQVHVYDRSVSSSLKKYKNDWEKEFKTPFVLMEL